MPRVQIIEKSCHREGLKVERLRNFFEGNGYIVVEGNHGLDPTNKYAFPLEDLRIDPDADLYVLTTCGFTQAIEDGDFSALALINKHKRDDAQVILGGCLTKINPERVASEFGGSTFDMDDYSKINTLVNAKVPLEQFPEPRHMPNTERFFITIQEGCSSRCSYCSIWKTGDNRSRPMEEILSKFREGLDRGHRRIYFIGENAGSYGLDLEPRTNLGNLLSEVLKFKEDFKLVLEDVNPMYVKKNFAPLLELCRQNKVESFHCPIQSANPRILRLMRRMCKMDEFLGMIQQLRAASSDLILSSAVIVGFPSETREELDETIKFCHAAGYDTVACHMFSQRPGNPANDMPGQISHEEKVWRYRHFKEQFKGTTRVDPNQRPLVAGDHDRHITTEDIIAAMEGHDPHGHHHDSPKASGLVQLRVGRKAELNKEQPA
jgi:MiaB/RimO family radical SAM methylthiotransferase